MALLAGGTVVSLISVQGDERVVHNILCTSQSDAQRNLRASIKFLREHPHGSADFSKTFILNAIQQDRERVQTLSDLSCH